MKLAETGGGSRREHHRGFLTGPEGTSTRSSVVEQLKDNDVSCFLDPDFAGTKEASGGYWAREVCESQLFQNESP